MTILFFIAWGLAVIYCNYKAAIIAKWRVNHYIFTPLPDILHDILPEINTHVPDYLLLICSIYILLRGIPVNTIDITHLLFSLTFRPVFVCMTSFPTCVKVHENPSVYSKLFLSQYDLMFSGHTCVFIFLGGTIKGSIGSMIQFLFPMSLIAARQHYTIDVVVAMLFYNWIKTFHMETI